MLSETERLAMVDWYMDRKPICGEVGGVRYAIQIGNLALTTCDLAVLPVGNGYEPFGHGGKTAIMKSFESVYGPGLLPSLSIATEKNGTVSIPPGHVDIVSVPPYLPAKKVALVNAKIGEYLSTSESVAMAVTEVLKKNFQTDPATAGRQVIAFPMLGGESGYFTAKGENAREYENVDGNIRCILTAAAKYKATHPDHDFELVLIVFNRDAGLLAERRIKDDEGRTVNHLTLLRGELDRLAAK